MRSTEFVPAQNLEKVQENCGNTFKVRRGDDEPGGGKSGRREVSAHHLEFLNEHRRKVMCPRTELNANLLFPWCAGGGALIAMRAARGRRLRGRRLCV
ncbi:hypothetical protein EVAR_56558_1 [Eumeta japonica]|uniref:Uncharacterized protein n=1 Tax=Eumeta variegata TaxID=151549 RepID=A0A4C1ZWL4_EUMVA|nr:hypothetical protein EVAR_56558_1 [Eumeta japonica]